MTLRQLSLLCAIVDNRLSISDAARQKFISQPSVSRQIQLLEEELNVQIFVRSRKRITGLTQAGEEILRLARSAIRSTEDLRQVGLDYSNSDHGRLVVAASHAHARYSLPDVITSFIEKHPHVRVALRQGDPSLIAQWVSSGDADFSISPEPTVPISDVVFLQYSTINRVVLTPKKHPLSLIKPLTLEALSKFPLITYNSEFSAHTLIVKAFQLRGLTPNIILSASNVDVMKTYVRKGLGIAIIATIAHDAEEDRMFDVIDAQHLFEPTNMSIGIKKGSYLRPYAYDFIKLFAPTFSRQKIDRALNPPSIPKQKKRKNQ